MLKSKNFWITIIVVFIIGIGAGYFLKDEKVSVEYKDRVVTKYVKGDTITIKPDGTTVVTNGSIDSNEHSSEYNKTEINKKTFMIMPLVGVGHEFAFGGVVQKDIWGGIGLGAGGLYNNTQKSGMVLIGISGRF